MDVRLLGPIWVLDDGGRPVELRHRKVLLLLSVLAVRAPAPVRVDDLIDALWPDALPARPGAALQTYVSRLRAALGDPERVQRHGHSYLLALSPHESDLTRFERLVADGRTALADGDALTASVRLREALRLFRGPVFAELTYEECLQDDLRRLEQQRLGALADRIDADLRLGRHDSCIDELEAVVLAHPSVERFATQLTRARVRPDRNGAAPGSLDRDRTSEESVGRAMSIPSGRGGTARVHEPRRLPEALGAIRTGPLVGRRGELDDLVAHRRGLALVTGEPGIGKTRLAAEAAHERARCGAEIWFGRCHERSLWLFEPFVEMVGDALERLGPDAAELLGRIPDLGRLVPDLAAAAATSVPVAVDEATARRRCVSAVAELAREVADSGGLTMVIDDIHWADTGTAHLVSMLARDHHDLALIVTGRRPGGPPAHLELGDRDITTAVHLGGLSADEVAELTRLVADVAPTPRDTLHERTGGNPLFVRALAAELAGHGPQRASTGPAGADTPAAMRAVIDSRVAALDHDVQSALAVVAVAGGDVAVSLVEQVAGPHVAAGLDEASAAGLLREGGTPGTCAFVHGLLRDAAYDRLGTAQRRELHLSIADLLEGDLPGGGDRVAMAIATHLAASGDASARTRAAFHAAAAAHRALRDHRFEESARRFELALELVDAATDPFEVSDRLVGRATALRRAGSATASAAIGEAIAASRDAGDAALMADAVLLLADHRPDATFVAHHDAALEALGSDTSSEGIARRARLLVARGWHATLIDLAAATASVSDGQRLAEAEGVLPAMAHAQIFEWEMAPLARSPGDRLSDATALLETAEAASDLHTQITAHNLRANSLLELGDLAAAEEAIAAGDQLAGITQLPAQLALGAQRRAMRCILRGALDEAERHAADALTLMGADPSYAPIHLGQLSAIRALQGRPSGLAELIEADHENRDRPVALAARAALRARCGETVAARKLLDAFVQAQLDDIPRDLFWTVTMALAADAAVLTEHREVATLVRARLSERAGNVVVFGYGALCWGTVERFTAPLALLLGDLEAARAEYERSLTVHTRIGATPFIAYDQLGLARVLERLGEQPERVAALRESGDRVVQTLGIVAPHLP